MMPERILLVDDVITKGRTLIAAATRVHEAFPQAPICAFALLRTMGLVAESLGSSIPAWGRFAGGAAMRIGVAEGAKGANRNY
jgi:Na+/citrate or Na+/malate symporter